MAKTISVVTLILLAMATPQAMAQSDDADVRETLEVKRAKSQDLDHDSLRFLRANRDFLRAQLDRVRLEIKRERDGEAQVLDERYLRLREMSAQIAAARDTVALQADSTARLELLNSIQELGDLETSLDAMSRVLDGQRQRLLALENDYLGHQRTALVIVMRGELEKDAPEALVLTEGNDELRIALDADQREALAKGAIVQIFHEFVEPREHAFELSFAGEKWTSRTPAKIAVEATRDQLTFLEIDLASLSREDARLAARVWQR